MLTKDIVYRIIIFFIPLIGLIGLVFIYNAQGVLFTFDSSQYLIAAITFKEQFSLLDITGNPLVLLPPLYSVFISVFFYGNMSSLFLANCFLFLSQSFVSFHLSKYLFVDKNYQLFFYFLSILSIPIYANFVFIWSESLFILLLLSALYLSLKYIKEESQSDLIFSVIVFSLLPLVRIVGIVFLAVFVLFFLLKYKRLSVIFSGIPFLVWILRNYYISDSLINEYDVASFTFLSNVSDSFIILYSYFMPSIIGSNSVKIIVVLLILGFLLFQIFKNHSNYSILYVFLLAFSYFGFMLFSNTLKTIFVFDDRYLVPFYLLFFILLIQIFETNSFSKNKFIVYGLMGYFTLYISARTLNNVVNWEKFGGGFSSQLFDFKSNEDCVYSNNAALVVASTLKKSYYVSETALKQMKSKGKCVLIWFYKIDYNYSLPISEIMNNFTIIDRKNTENATIYTLVPIEKNL